MNEKMIGCVIGSVVSGTLAVISYFVEHSTSLAALGAVIASIFTAMAAFEKWRFFRKKRKEFDEV